MSGVLAVIAHLATKADVMELRSSVADVRTAVARVETAIIKWIIATTLASGALAFAAAKLVH